ncbi:hypothetical protein ACE939_15500 [Aquimarina sp. W85]|uniref:hypothetical protein n=1 Tax=Aquimarina rhodophyticola TaxID=3342246 RepID=UPI003671B2C2
MKYTYILIIGGLALLNLIYTFIKIEANYEIFGYSTNLWTYRLIWAVMVVLCGWSYFVKKRS